VSGNGRSILLETGREDVGILSNIRGKSFVGLATLAVVVRKGYGATSFRLLTDRLKVVHSPVYRDCRARGQRRGAPTQTEEVMFQRSRVISFFRLVEKLVHSRLGKL
jgi:hypothetical protein